jgi:hypothetical protein
MKLTEGRLENNNPNDVDGINVDFQQLRRSTDVKTDDNDDSDKSDDNVAKQFSTVECSVKYFVVATVSVEFYLYVDKCRRNNDNLFTKRPPQLSPCNYFNNTNS